MLVNLPLWLLNFCLGAMVPDLCDFELASFRIRDHAANGEYQHRAWSLDGCHVHPTPPPTISTSQLTPNPNNNLWIVES